jgi:hypothetical protein
MLALGYADLADGLDTDGRDALERALTVTPEEALAEEQAAKRAAILAAGGEIAQ